MKKLLNAVIAAALLLAPVLSFAASTEDNLKAAKSQTQDALKELREAKGNNANSMTDESTYREKGSAYSEYKTSGLGPEYYAKTAESPYTKSKIAQGIAAIAATAASSIGTSMQASVVSQLTAMINDLIGSGVPEYKAMAADLQKEVAFIKTGDSISAKKTAENIAAYAATNLPVDPSYVPTASESAAMDPFTQFFKGFLSSILSVLSNQAIAILTAALGTIFGGPVGAVLGGSVGTILSSLASSLINNTPIDATAMGAAAASSVNSAITGAGSSITTGIKISTTPSVSNTTSNTSNTAPIPQNTGSDAPALNVSKDGSAIKSK